MDMHFRFQIGQPIHHKVFDYRGVVVEADSNFNQSDIWYTVMTQSNPPKDVPWYYILVDNSDCTCYVCERNLEPDLSGKTVNNPNVNLYFNNLDCGLYRK